MDAAPTEKQISFITSLVSQRQMTENLERLVEQVDLMSRKDASQLIEALLAAPKKLKSGLRKPYQSALEVGMYTTDTGEVLRVYLGKQSGMNLVKRLVLHGDDYEYEYVGSAHRVVAGESKLGPVYCTKMSREEAQNWGRMTSYCVACGKKLDDPDSVDRGMGPVCFKKF